MDNTARILLTLSAVFAVWAALGFVYGLIVWLMERRRPVLPPPSAHAGRPYDQQAQTRRLREVA